MTIYNGTSGNDTFTIADASDLQAGDVFNGNGGFDTIFIASYTTPYTDFTQITLNGISAIVTSSMAAFDPITLTIAELGNLSEVTGITQLADGGTISLAGKTIGPTIQLANADTTLDLTGAISGGTTIDSSLFNYLQSFQVGFDVICGTGNYTITGSSTYDTAIRGGAGNDIIHAGSVDTIIGGGGGLDMLYGGAGNDTFVLNSATPELAGTVIDGGGGNNTLFCNGPVDLTQLSISNIQTIEGSIYGASGPSVDLSKLPAGINLSGQINIVGTGNANFGSVVLAPNVRLSFGSGITAVDFSNAQLLNTGNNNIVIGVTLSGSVASFTGGNFAYSLSDSQSGPLTVNSGSGNGSVTLGAGGGTVNGGSGNLVVYVNGGQVNVVGASGNVALVFDASAASGSTFSGGTGAGNNTVEIDAAGVDLSNVTFTNFTTLSSSYYTVLSQSLVNGFSTFSGNFSISGAVAPSFSGKTLNNFLIKLGSSGGTVDFTGATITGQGVSVIANNAGPNVITGSAGDDDIFTSGLGDTIHAGAGNDTVTISSPGGLITGTFDGGSGSNILTASAASGTLDLSQATITNFQALLAPGSFYLTPPVVKLTAAELGSFTTQVSGGDMTLVDGGTISLAGVQGGSTPSQLASFQLSNSATSLDLRGFIQTSVTVTGGDGNDTIYGIATNIGQFSSGDVNVLYGGGGNDTLVGSTGHDYLDGGTGTNTSVYTGNLANYRIDETAADGAAYTLADQRSGTNDGIDTLVNIQLLQFADTTLDLTASTVSLTSDGQVLVLAPGQTFDLSNASTIGDAVSGDNGTINLTNANLTASGANQVITTSSNNAVIVSSGASNSIQVNGNNATVTAGGNGQTTNAIDTVTFASGGTANIADNSRVSVAGNGSTVNVGSNDYVGAVGSSGTVTVNGTNSAVWVGGNGQTTSAIDSIDFVSAGTANIIDNSRVGVTGIGELVNVGNNDFVGIVGASAIVNVTGANSAVWVGGNGQTTSAIDSIAFAGVGTANILDNSRVNVSGSGETVNVGNYDFAGAIGSSEIVNVNGTNSAVWVGGNGQTSSAIDGINFAAGGTANIIDNSRVSLSGDGANVNVGNYDFIGAVGSSETVNVNGTNSAVWIGGNGQTTSAIDNIAFAAAGTANIIDDSRVSVSGTGETVNVGNNDFVGAIGSSETVKVTGSNSAVWIGGNGEAASVADAISFGAGGTANVLADSNVSVAGNGVSINLAARDAAALLGQSDTVALTGTDNLSFATAIGHATLAGFDSGDQITLSKASFGAQANGFNYWAHLLADATFSGGNTTITIDGSDSIVLQNYTLTNANQSQFHFV